jgi:regulator of protease activity HflC (stomatin/prohibitin superfamily)
MITEAVRLPRRERWLAGGIGALLALALLVLLFWRSIVVIVPPGHVGVEFRLLLGGVEGRRVTSEGLVVKLPWNWFFLYDTRLQSRIYEVKGLTAEGMPVTTTMLLLFRARPETVARLHEVYGPDYVDRIVSPLITGITREVISHHSSHEFYSTDSSMVRDEVVLRLRKHPIAETVDFTSVHIQQVTLPPAVLTAIEDKLRAQQVAASYPFRISAEEQEAERKRIEAIGIQNFYAVVAGALTPSLLTWRGIEATVEIARAPNSKVVIVGGGKDQLPLILGSDIAGVPPAGPPPAAVGPNANPLPDWDKAPRLFATPHGPSGPAAP